MIYFYSAAAEVIALLDIYAKEAKKDLSNADKKDIREAIREIRDALGAR